MESNMIGRIEPEVSVCSDASKSSEDRKSKIRFGKAGKKNIFLSSKTQKNYKTPTQMGSINPTENKKRKLWTAYLEDQKAIFEHNEKLQEESNFSEVEISSTIAEFGDIDVKKKKKKKSTKKFDHFLRESAEEILATKFCEALDLTSSEDEGGCIMIINPKKKIKPNIKIFNKCPNTSSTPETSDSEA